MDANGPIICRFPEDFEKIPSISFYSTEIYKSAASCALPSDFVSSPATGMRLRRPGRQRRYSLGAPRGAPSTRLRDLDETWGERRIAAPRGIQESWESWDILGYKLQQQWDFCNMVF